MLENNARFILLIVTAIILLFGFNFCRVTAAQPLLDKPSSTMTATQCFSEQCLVAAAEAESQFLKGDDFIIFAGKLARAKRFTGAQAAMAVYSEIAASSWMKPTEIASYERLDPFPDASGNQPDEFELASRYWLLAEQIIEKFEPTGVSLPLEKLLRPKVLRHGPNATLDDLLNVRWPKTIEKLPKQKQGQLWDYVAQIYIELGNTTAAISALNRAEKCGDYDFQGKNRAYVTTISSWLRLGNFDRALEAAQHTDPRNDRSSVKVGIAKELVAAGQKDRARKIFDEAAADFEQLDDKSRNINLLLEIINGYMGMNDPVDARRVADRLLEVARLPALFPSDKLAAAARGFNDIGDHAHALDLLREAVKRLPDDHKIIALGPTLGPISGATLGVGDSIRSEIATEFYRAGDQADFNEQFALLNPFHQKEITMWRWHDDLGKSHPELSPHLDTALATLSEDSRLSVILEFATDAVTYGETEIARKLLKKSLEDRDETPNPLALAEIAKVAFGGGYSDLTADILHKAAVAAFKIEDKSKRAVALASVAAAEHELLN